MASLRNRMANRLVRMLGIRRRLQDLADTAPGSADFAQRVAKLRRADRLEPPARLKRAWEYERIDVGGFALHLLRPPGSGSRRVIYYLHAGGYMFGPFATEWAAASRVAKATGCDVAFLIYPKAPEHQAPRTIETTMRAYDLLEERYGAASLILVGTSAGGALAIVLLVDLRDMGRPPPASAVLLSPGVDMTLEDDYSALEADDVMLSADHVRVAGSIYAGSLGADHPRVSPTFANLSGLATPLHVFAGTAEILFPGIETFVARAASAGSVAHLIVGEGQQHTWPVAPTPEGREALRQVIAIIGPATAEP